jgi:hypothetical protein
MSDPSALLAFASAGTTAVGVTAAAALRAWQDWLKVRRLELGGSSAGRAPGARPEIAELRRRVRRLEAIANGCDL